MKKFAALLLSLTLTAALAGCGSAPAASSSPAAPSHSGPASSQEPSQSTQLPNPLVEVEGPEAFQELGIVLDAPDGAESVVYHLLNGSTAQVGFTLDGEAYLLRAAKTQEDISGIYQEFEEEALGLTAGREGHSTQVEIKTITEGGRLAKWFWNDVQFSLHTAGDVANDAISALCLALAGTTYIPE